MARIAPMVCVLASGCARPEATRGSDAAGTNGGDSALVALDADGDGFLDGVDCNDDDAAIHPGAAEHCDGVDEDCDTAIDDEAVDAPTWYADVDGDGYGGEKHGAACSSTVPSDVGTDGDCDDTDSSTHPGATEICGDASDNDCAAGDDPCRLAGSVPGLDHLHVIGPGEIAPRRSMYYYGFVAAAGDTNGDGEDDLMVGFQSSDDDDDGVVVVCLGPLLDVHSFADCTTSMTSPDSNAYVAYVGGVGMGDLDADGYDDIAIADAGSQSSDDEGIFVFHGPLEDTLVPADADAVFNGRLGASMDAGPVVDGQRLLIASGWSGDAYIIDASPPPFEPVSQLHGDALSYHSHVEDVGDVDGDGVTDLAISEAWSALFLVTCPAYLISGAPIGPYDVADAQASFGDTTHRVGGIGDTNGDGYSDLVVQAIEGHASEAHASFLFGPVSGDFVVGESTFDGTLAFHPFERRYAIYFEDIDGLDVDGDSLSDVVASFLDGESPVEIAYGPITGASDPDVWLAPGTAPVLPGPIAHLADLGDVNGDGYGDVAFQGSPVSLSGSPLDEPGNVYLLLGTGL